MLVSGSRRWLEPLVRAAHPLSAVAIAWLSHRLLRASTPLGLAALPLAWLFIGSRFRALGNMMHECAHGTFASGRRANRLFGHLLGFFDFTSFPDYVREHLSHHRRLGDPDADLDYRARRALFESLGPFGWSYLAYALTLRHLPHFIRPVLFSRRDPALVALARVGFNVSLVGLAHFVIGWPAFLLYYVVPYLTTYQVFRFLSDAVDHAGLMTQADELGRSRNHVHRWAWVNWLVFPRQDQYHLVHHLFPRVPCAHLRPVHELLLASPVYAEREHDLSRLLRGEPRP